MPSQTTLDVDGDGVWVERRGPGMKGPKMRLRSWRVSCPVCRIKSSVHGPEHQKIFECPGCGLRAAIKGGGGE